MSAPVDAALSMATLAVAGAQDEAGVVLQVPGNPRSAGTSGRMRWCGKTSEPARPDVHAHANRIRSRTLSRLPLRATPAALVPLAITLGLTCLALIGVAAPASAQNYGLDARGVGMGAVGSVRNIASPLAPRRRKFQRVGMPFGLTQILKDLDIFIPDTDQFDPISIAPNMRPIRFISRSGATRAPPVKPLIDDVIDGDVNRDLTAYRLFAPATRLTAEGVGAPSIGITIRFLRHKEDAGYHGIYIGGGPYLTVTTETLTDPRLVNLLGGPVPVPVPNASLGVVHLTTGQIAAAITGGYRAFLPRVPGQPGSDGIYLAANVSYLLGFHLADLDARIRFDTDADGLLTLQPTTVPIDVILRNSSSGRGIAADIGAVAVVGRWDFGMGLNGVANRMTWQRVELDRFQLTSFVDGSELEEVPVTQPVDPLKITVPLNFSANAAYDAGRWSAAAEYARRFGGNNIQSGVEYRLKHIDLRAGMRFARDRWHPAGGVGLHLGGPVALDVAFFSSSTNAERRRHLTMAVSLRFETPAVG